MSGHATEGHREEDRALFRRLKQLAEKTSMPVVQAGSMDERLEIALLAASCPVGYPGGRAGNVADYRRAHDDIAAGRLHWRQAHDEAIDGLYALQNGDLEMARFCAWQATDFYIAALEGRIRPQDLRELRQPAKPRGRKRKVIHNK